MQNFCVFISLLKKTYKLIYYSTSIVLKSPRDFLNRILYYYFTRFMIFSLSF
ncbi:hypothetical protein GLOIN_2v1631233, partial [Rhizophagus irregularis DAOM 181602=DAOM 197198]